MKFIFYSSIYAYLEPGPNKNDLIQGVYSICLTSSKSDSKNNLARSRMIDNWNKPSQTTNDTKNNNSEKFGSMLITDEL